MYELSKSKEDAVRRIDNSYIPSHTLNNHQLPLREHEQYFRENYHARFNEVTTSYEIAQEVTNTDGSGSKLMWEDLSTEELHNDLLRAVTRQKVSDQDIRLLLADRRLVPSYNPFVEYFNTLPQVPKDAGYIRELASFVKIDTNLDSENERWLLNFEKALVRSVKCALNENYFNKHCVVLFSDSQHAGKTTYLTAICPPKLRKYFSSEPISQDKDSQIQLSTNFIVLLDELASLSRLDINYLKAILSKIKINVRLPYAKRSQVIPRRANFFATTNRTDFLMDKENVRWLVFNVKDIDKNYGNPLTDQMNVDIDKVWAEAYALSQDITYNCELTKKDLELNEINNDLYSSSSLIQEVINEYLTPANDPNDKFKEGYVQMQSSKMFELLCDLLAEDGRDHLKLDITKFYWEISKIKGFTKHSFRNDSGVVCKGYKFFINKNKSHDNQIF